jgi:predicted MFS family arabinose efflux permease
LVLTALFFGTFVMGSAELIVVGILDLVADDLDVSIGVARSLVTSYAPGISLGGLLLTALTIRFARKAAPPGLAGRLRPGQRAGRGGGHPGGPARPSGAPAADRDAGATIIAGGIVLVPALAASTFSGSNPVVAAVALFVWGIVGFGMVPSVRYRVVSLAGPGRGRLGDQLPRAGPRTGGDFGALNGWFSGVTTGRGR